MCPRSINQPYITHVPTSRVYDVFFGGTVVRIFSVSGFTPARGVPVARVRVVPWQRVFQGVLSAEPAHAGAVPVSQRCRGHVPAWVQGTLRLPLRLVKKP
jgi:hypothetical protein